MGTGGKRKPEPKMMKLSLEDARLLYFALGVAEFESQITEKERDEIQAKILEVWPKIYLEQG